MFDGLRGAVPIFTYEKDGYAKSGYLGGICVRFGALRGAPGVTDGRFTIPRGGQGRTNQRDLTGDRFQVIAPLFTY